MGPRIREDTGVKDHPHPNLPPSRGKGEERRGMGPRIREDNEWGLGNKTGYFWEMM